VLRRKLEAQNSLKKLEIKMELYSFIIKMNRIAHTFFQETHQREESQSQNHRMV